MASPAVDITALADEIASLARLYANPGSIEPGSFEHHQTAQHIVHKARNLINHVQDPFLAPMDHSTNIYQVSCIRAFIDMGIFETIPTKGSMHVKEIAAATQTDEVLIIRMMRMLTSTGIFEEPKLHEFSHNALSIVYSKDTPFTQQYYLALSYDEQFPAIFQQPIYFRKFGYKDVHTLTETPHSFAHGTLGKNFWETMATEPGRHEAFDRGLAGFETLAPPVGIYPFDTKHAAGSSSDRVLMVDVAGGRGGALLSLRETFPELKGKLILQDRPGVLDDISEDELPGIEKQVHDFFTPQPVHGAQIYYFRRVFHDWQNEDAMRILENIKPAMAKDSRILIAEMTIPEPVTAADAHAVWLDLMMMGIGGRERTRRDWEALIAGVEGLKLIEFWEKKEVGLQMVLEIGLDE